MRLNIVEDCVKLKNETHLYINMNYIGISCGYHDAALSVIDSGGNIIFAGHAERYSGVKGDRNLNSDLISDALQYVHGDYSLHYYEIPWLKYLRQKYSGEQVSLNSASIKNIVGPELLEIFNGRKVNTHRHHQCHAAAGFQTSPYDRATVVVIDAIGEWDTITIWAAEYRNDRATYKLLWKRSYPNSIGLLYSAVTKHLGLKPLDEEYILMGMAAYGVAKESVYVKNVLKTVFLDSSDTVTFKENLHIGLDDNILVGADSYNIASGTQLLTTELVMSIMKQAYSYGWSDNLVYMGGVALNCVTNTEISNKTKFSSIWIMPNPGDAGSSLGAASLAYGGRLNWHDAYLGYNITRQYPVEDALNCLLSKKIVGVANGRAEFGPRALGNRSLLADPRGHDIKDQVNNIKQRQKFRPFAPVILEEMVEEYFTMPRLWQDSSRYMQVVVDCKNPKIYPAIVHVDSTSRVQTVPPGDSGIRKLLEAWYQHTGCPMLLNTSLNIRGQPMVNNLDDAREFQKIYNITVV